jgi:hypothetical protein
MKHPGVHDEEGMERNDKEKEELLARDGESQAHNV